MVNLSEKCDSPRQLRSVDVRFQLLTAYSENYRHVGDLCAEVNERYAKEHCYAWKQVVLPDEEMLAVVDDRAHTTWYKVYLLLQELEKRLGPLPPALVGSGESEGNDEEPLEYLVWLDADAAVVDFAQKMEEIVELGGYRELIMGEDMHSGANLINCGVFFVKVSLFSQIMWQEIWDLEVSFRDKERPRGHINKPFYEQSALGRVLKRRKCFSPFFESRGRREGENSAPAQQGDENLHGKDVENPSAVDQREQSEEQSVRQETSPSTPSTCCSPPSTGSSCTRPSRISLPDILANRSSKPSARLLPIPVRALPILRSSAEFAAAEPIIGVDKKPVWHSFVYPPDHVLHWSIKIFENVAIYPMHAINSNVMDWDFEILATGRNPKGSSHHGSRGRRWHQRAGFIFHAAGFFGKKENLIRGMMERRGVVPGLRGGGVEVVIEAADATGASDESSVSDHRGGDCDAKREDVGC